MMWTPSKAIFVFLPQCTEAEVHANNCKNFQIEGRKPKILTEQSLLLNFSCHLTCSSIIVCIKQLSYPAQKLAFS